MSLYESREPGGNPPRRHHRLTAAVVGIALATAVIYKSPSAQLYLGLEKKPKTSPPVAGQTFPSETSSTLPEASTTTPTTAIKGVLTGKVIVIDPGHDGGNGSNPKFISQKIWNGRGRDTNTQYCDTVGAQTSTGDTESQYNMNVANALALVLKSRGATVILTRQNDIGVGPCVNERAAIANRAHADVALSIHADGGPVSGRGFTVFEPVASPINGPIVDSSLNLARKLVDSFKTVMPISTYDGRDGVNSGPNLGGLNMSTVPKDLIETGNMKNPTDAALLTNRLWQAKAAVALADGLTNFLTNA